LVDDGMIVVGAAGNQNRDACLYSPASEPSIISVGASDRSELRASYSNFGTCVDLFAPGSDLVGAWAGSTTTYRSSSGTSNAAPIVSGIVATMLQREPTLTQQQVEQRLVANATSGALFNIGVGSPNLLAFSGFVVAPDVPTSTTVPTTVPATVPSTTVPSTTVPPTTIAPPASLAPTTTVASRAVVSPPVPADLQCQTPAARVRFYGVPYVCVNVGTALMWIPQRYSPGRP
jgi:subtilisin family serine protease